ncbi:hypothetical protein ACKKBG_A36240 [Auxenochlorella protothecoides x Auxenochlorella symbiontica]
MRSSELLGKKTVSEKEWRAILGSTSTSQTSMNNFVMDYLVTEGYYEAAVAFGRETGTTTSANVSSAIERTQIRKAIQDGDIQLAMELLNDAHPQILEEQSGLLFHLQQQQVIELIRAGRTEAALDYAQEYLAPRSENNPDLLLELERTMALLIFDDVSTSPLADLMDVAQRQKTADEVNPCILRTQLEEAESQLPVLLKLMLWMQDRLKGKVVFPVIEDVLVAEPILAPSNEAAT